MNLLYLIKTLGTTKLSEVVQAMDMPPLDINIALWDAVDRGEIEVDEKKDKIKPLKEAETWHNPDITQKVIRVIKQYNRSESNVTAGRLNSYMKDATSGQGYPLHEYLMSVQYLIDNGEVVEEVISVPKAGERPFQRFVFLGLPENADKNELWNTKAVDRWISNWGKTKVK
jgi:hypothetical protein